MKQSMTLIALTAACLASACTTQTTATELTSVPATTETLTAAPAAREPISRSFAHNKSGFMEKYDADGDGRVTKAEFMAERESGYNLTDANGDGIVHEEEYVSEYEGRLKADLEERYKGQMDQAHVRFNVLDKDDDAEMTLSEFNASGENIFLNLDTNEDGIVDEADTAEHF